MSPSVSSHPEWQFLSDNPVDGTKDNMMRCLTFFLVISLAVTSCSSGDENTADNKTEFKQKMREFVIGISHYSKSEKPGFLIIPQNGIELVTINGDASGEPHTSYLNAIDANGQEDLCYGYDNDDQATSPADKQYLTALLNISNNAGKVILVTDYCSTPSKMADSYLQNTNAGYISFAASQRELSNIPGFPNPVNQENNAVITRLPQVKNFLYLINPANFTTKDALIGAVISTNYDLLIMDLFFTDGVSFTPSEVNQLKNKANGGKRLVVCYLSIGEAENYRYYWQPGWNTDKPDWLVAENPDWAGNYKVRYWDTAWQQIIYGNDNSYIKKITAADFDGVYLDIIDAFEYFEN